MKPYADDGPRRLRQQFADVAVLVWCLAFLWFGHAVHSAVLRLQEPGRQLQGAGNRLAGDFSDAARRVSSAPFVGDRLKSPLNSAADASRAVAGAGAAGQSAVAHVALVLAVEVALPPIALVVVVWLFFRVRYAREAGAAVLLRGDVELLALRAAATLPLSRLSQLAPDVLARWRRGEPGAAEALARLELATLGLRPAE